MIKKFIRKLSGKYSLYDKVSFASEADDVAAAVLSLPTLSAQVEYLGQCRNFRVDQQKPEFNAFLDKVAAANPKRVLEIGGRRGGSSFLFSLAAPEATIVSMDLDYGRRRLNRLQKLCKGRSIEFWQGDSHSAKTAERVQAWAGSDGIDVLFIDGDHTYDGAKADFCTYLPMVKQGGIVALHDIQPDFRSRFNVPTLRWAGGVPELWNDVKAAGFCCEDLISDEWQDGYGIGAVIKSATDEERIAQIRPRQTNRTAA